MAITVAIDTGLCGHVAQMDENAAILGCLEHYFNDDVFFTMPVRKVV